MIIYLLGISSLRRYCLSSDWGRVRDFKTPFLNNGHRKNENKNFMFVAFPRKSTNHTPLTKRGSNSGSDRTPDRIGWDWYLRFWCTINILRKAVLAMPQVARNKKLRKWHLRCCSLIDKSLSYLAHSAIFLIVSFSKGAFNLGLVKNKTSSEENRDGKKHKISAMRDNYTSLRYVRFGRCKCNRKFPTAVQLKIILCDDFQADGKFKARW